MPETTWDAARVDGKIYGVINQQIFVKPFGLNVRKDLADKYGLDVYALKSYDEREPFLKAILENEPDVIPLPGASTWSNEGNGFDPIITEQVPVVIRPARLWPGRSGLPPYLNTWNGSTRPAFRR